MIDTQRFQLRPGTHLTPLDVSSYAATYLAQVPGCGQVQLSERLYHLLACLDTPKSSSALARAFFERTSVPIAEDVVRQVIMQVLMPRGLIISETDAETQASFQADQGVYRSPPSQSHSTSILAVHFAKDVLPAKVLAPLTQVLQHLYNPFLAIVLLLASVILHAIIYWRIGLPPMLDTQGVSWALVYGLFMFSALIHELGHLSACRRWRCEHGALGIALYFFMPAFYVDVSHTWRLSRWQRVIIDFGGIYFQLIFTIGLVAAFWFTQQAAYLWTMLLIDVALLVNLNPLLKLDGYWVLSDMFGVANLHKRSWELLRFSASWLAWKLRLRSVQPGISVFGQLPPTVLLGLMWYTTLAINGWMLASALMIPLIIRATTTYPTTILNAVTAIQVALPTSDFTLVFVALDSLFLPTLIVINIVLLIRRLCRSLFPKAFRVTRKLYAYS